VRPHQGDDQHEDDAQDMAAQRGCPLAEVLKIQSAHGTAPLWPRYVTTLPDPSSRPESGQGVGPHLSFRGGENRF